MDGAPVVHGDGAGRSDEVHGRVERHPREILVPDVAGPAAVPVIVLVNSALVAARHDPRRSLPGCHVLDEDQHDQGREIGVGIEGDVLMPLHLRSAPGPLVVDHALAEGHVRSHEIGSQIDQDRLRAELPEHRVLVVEVGDASQAWAGGAVIRLQVEDAVRSGQARAALDEDAEGSAHALKPRAFQQRLECDEALLEVVLTLLRRQHPAGMRNDLVAGHGRLRSSCQDSGLSRIRRPYPSIGLE